MPKKETKPMRYLAPLLLLIPTLGCHVSSPKKNTLFHFNQDYALVNNQYGTTQLDSTDTYEQTIFLSRNQKGTPHLPGGWNWKSSSTKQNVKGFPNVFFGQNPYRNDWNSTEKLPLQLKCIDSCSIHANFTVNAQGRFNACLEIWITNTNTNPKPQNITHEIMVWIVDQSQIQHKGSLILHNIYLHPNPNPWTFYIKQHPKNNHILTILTTPQIHTNQTIPLHNILQTLQSIGILHPDLYLASVALGTEIWSGSGYLYLKNFHVHTKTKPTPHTAQQLQSLNWKQIDGCYSTFHINEK
jgi:hypothetical protein